MTEDDMLTGITDALSHGGWLWTHQRRSDLGLNMGMPGVPDVIAVHPKRHRLLVLELKADRGRYRPGQAEWLQAMTLAGVDARTIRPADYDPLVDELLGDRIMKRRRAWTDSPDER